MVYVNSNYSKLDQSFFFTTIRRKTKDFEKMNPELKIIRMGIGDVTLPIVPIIQRAMHDAVDELGRKETFRGYGPEEGYDFLKLEIKNSFSSKNVTVEQDEIFIGDGIKSDMGNIVDIFGSNQTVLIPTPVYPAYLDVGIMSGYEIIYSYADEKNKFLPGPDVLKDKKPDLIYLCSPNNPTGAVYSHQQLKEWVDYAKSINSIILFDAAYECFINEDRLPRTIYEIPGAKECAIEFLSLSKTAGFTGIRCGFTIVPKQLKGYLASKEQISLNSMWRRRQSTKFNGVSYVVQKAAQAAFSETGQKEIMENIKYYAKNAKVICEALDEVNFTYYGGKNSPYIWLKCKDGMKSWEFFDYLLEKAGIVGTPGAGYGTNGEGFFRLTAFGSYEDTVEGMERFKQLFQK